MCEFNCRDCPGTPSCLLIIASNKIVLVGAISFIFHIMKGKRENFHIVLAKISPKHAISLLKKSSAPS